MQLHGESVLVGERVYDISVNRGYGTIVKVEDNYFQVKFKKFSVNYNENGIQQARDVPTLYWTRPLIIAPPKDEVKWTKRKVLIEEFFSLVKNYAEFL